MKLTCMPTAPDHPLYNTSHYKVVNIKFDWVNIKTRVDLKNLVNQLLAMKKRYAVGLPGKNQCA
jgi:hypothetical protein